MMSVDATDKRGRHAGRRRHAAPVALGVFVLAAMVVFAILLLMLREPPQEVAADVPVPGGALSRPERTEAPATIRSRGVVAPKVRLHIMPEVAGRVVYVHAQLHAGGLIRANERIARIDPSGYDLAVRRARAAVDEAQARLDLELAAAGLRREPGQSLDAEAQAKLPAVLHEPLVRQATAAVESARAELASAELQLARTSIVLPFDVLIAGEAVSLGQYVEAGRPLALAYGTETFEVEAAVPSESLGLLGGLERLGFAGDASREAHATAEVKAVFAGGEHTWPGEVVRTTGQVDPNSGSIALIVEVPRPLEGSAGRPALLPGTAVEVLIRCDPAAGTVQNTENVGDL